MTRSILLVSAVALLVSGCLRVPGGVAPSNIPLEQGRYTVLGPVEAQDCKIDVLGILPVSGGNQVSDAIKRALARSPGADALVGVTIDRVTKFFILWTQTCTEIRATAVSVP